MCIRDVRIYTCLGQEERDVKTHIEKVNILCAALEPCPADLWDRRETRHPYGCPSCTGRSSLVTPAGLPDVVVTWTTPRHDDVDAQFADRYVSDWASYMRPLIGCLLTHTWGPRGALSWDDMYAAYAWLTRETACKEHSHWLNRCRCDANASDVRRFLYNPATALRTMAATRAGQPIRDLVYRRDAVHPSRHSEVIERATAEAASETRLRREHAERKEAFPFFRDGRARCQPYWEAQFKFRTTLLEHQARTTLLLEDRASRPWHRMWGDEPEMLDMEAHDNGVRTAVLRCMGHMMVEDIGLSDARLQLVLERLFEIVPAPTWLVQQKSDWFAKETVYQQSQLLFWFLTREVTGAQLRAGTQLQTQGGDGDVPEGRDVPEGGDVPQGAQDVFCCPLCTNAYFDAADGAELLAASPAGHGPGESHGTSVHSRTSADERSRDREDWAFYYERDRYCEGEVPVEIVQCGHVFGARCLFQLLVRQGPETDWSCPDCRRCFQSWGRQPRMAQRLLAAVREEQPVDDGTVG
ncbi:uncharacterized protein VDAG_06708 [Verticillium dahliae VdLs.17]|uniref:RING-type domain-containing protein n=2 Tax=Verticillium dahliae TaxID=27337 RepID=G2X976_VERDV|nr:uncharacterized protein VDAG_06708 [Verticillium dahliae VdLs.17]EGY15544.1 hypothetical protein VDAG_06708 [Verticillium dahliae VdLs.17]KAH6687615.1 hypothetical protein EV126DRAFT_486114 [Verticillium dahliae]PNH35729.1 hypothetical protein BJF96_g971 [Verticillium dahliae]PNH48677.1 hypothetical protein VD0003_g8438 [Verticillium dahliae]